MSDAITIAQLVERSHALAKSKGWYETWPDGKTKVTAINVPEKLALIHSEVSEALEAFRSHGVRRRCVSCNGDGWHDSERPCEACMSSGFLVSWVEPASGSLKPEGFVVELADAVIRIADLCGALGICLSTAIEVKHAYNETRAFRHGGKNA